MTGLSRTLDAVPRDLPGVAVLACDASTADAPDRVFAVQALRILLLCGGAIPPCRPFPEVDWEEFSGNWNNDVRMSFHFLQAALERLSITWGASRMISMSNLPSRMESRPDSHRIARITIHRQMLVHLFRC
jgi:hypothetical protein